jgi:hypothetical protein
MQYQYSYGSWPQATVTVRASDAKTAYRKACAEMDRRYEKAGQEPPVAWTLQLLRTYDLPARRDT